MKKLGKVLVLGLLSISMMAGSVSAMAKGAKSSDVRGAAPDFTLKSKAGKNLRLSDYKGQVVLINFWASWCAPCRTEMPLLDDLHKRYESLGFTVLGINLDEDQASAEKVLSKIPVTFPILYDSKNVVSEAYKVEAMPTTYLIDRDGNMRKLFLGYKAGYEAKYEKAVKALVRER